MSSPRAGNPRVGVSVSCPVTQLGLLGFSRVIKVRVGVRVGIGIRVNLVLELGWDRSSRRGMSGVICRVPDV